MEQQVLSVTYNDETIISKVFDFEAMCLIDDARAQKLGIMRMGYDAVLYLFEGTKITDKVLANLPLTERTALSVKVSGWYNDTLDNALKNI